MRKFLSILLISLFTLSFLISDAQAKRFGGGRSFGVQRSMTKPMPQNTFNQARPASPAGASKWLAPLAGLALGGMLATLLMGNGFGSGILSWLLIAGVIFLIFKFIRSRSQAFAPHQQMQAHGSERQSAFPFMSQASQGSAAMNQAAMPPLGFDTNQFLREAKSQFIRLQTAYDQKDTNDLRQFTTPEVFAEIQLQLQERGEVSNQTEVVSLDAELLEAANESPYAMVASVQFSGTIREDANQTVAAFNEIWHFRKDDYTNRWMVSGVQQN